MTAVQEALVVPELAFRKQDRSFLQIGRFDDIAVRWRHNHKLFRQPEVMLPGKEPDIGSPMRS